jgi:hypothetical protein
MRRLSIRSRSANLRYTMTVSAHPDGGARVHTCFADYVWTIFELEGVNLPTHSEGLRAAIDGGSFSPGHHRGNA